MRRQGPVLGVVVTDTGRREGEEERDTRGHRARSEPGLRNRRWSCLLERIENEDREGGKGTLLVGDNNVLLKHTVDPLALDHHAVGEKEAPSSVGLGRR